MVDAVTLPAIIIMTIVMIAMSQSLDTTDVSIQHSLKYGGVVMDLSRCAITTTDDDGAVETIWNLVKSDGTPLAVLSSSSTEILEYTEEWQGKKRQQKKEIF